MPRILVIDDDENTRDILRRMLTRRGYEVLEAENGFEGIRCFQEEGADLVVTDVLMPEKEGLETIQELREEFPSLKIIVMSGGGKLGNAGDFLMIAKIFGAAYSFQKPIPREKFLGAVEALIGPGDPAGGFSKPGLA